MTSLKNFMPCSSNVSQTKRYLISGLLISNGCVGFRGHVETSGCVLVGRLVGVVNSVEVNVVVERPEKTRSRT